MSEKQIQYLFAAVERMSEQIDALQESIADLRKVDKRHDKELKLAHKQGRNKALAATIVPAAIGVSEAVKAIAENWPF